MSTLVLDVQDFGFIVGTRAALAAGIGLLASTSLSDERRQSHRHDPAGRRRRDHSARHRVGRQRSPASRGNSAKPKTASNSTGDSSARRDFPGRATTCRSASHASL